MIGVGRHLHLDLAAGKVGDGEASRQAGGFHGHVYPRQPVYSPFIRGRRVLELE